MRRLNEGLGLTPPQARAIVTDAPLAAEELIRKCDSLLQTARELRRRYDYPHHQVELECVLIQLELGMTFCRVACTGHDARKERLLRNTRRALSHAIAAVGKFEFSMQGVEEISAGINRLQSALEECIGPEW
jgi:hypothetical protein